MQRRERVEQKLGAWASIFGVLALIGSWFADPSKFAQSVREWIYGLSLVAVCLGVGIWFLLARTRLKRKARYADELAKIESAVNRITALISQDRFSDDEPFNALKQSLDDLADVFTEISGTKCRSCLKTISLKDNSLEARTCGRSGYNASGSEAKDDSHLIQSNTDFNQLYQDTKQKWFFGNNLPELAKNGRYNNSNESWQSFYVASLVWPIRRVFSQADKKPDFVGFLCVDSRKIEVFAEEYDYPIGALLADALYPFLKKIESLQTEGIESNDGLKTILHKPHVISNKTSAPSMPEKK